MKVLYQSPSWTSCHSKPWVEPQTDSHSSLFESTIHRDHCSEHSYATSNFVKFFVTLHYFLHNPRCRRTCSSPEKNQSTENTIILSRTELAVQSLRNTQSPTSVSSSLSCWPHCLILKWRKLLLLSCCKSFLWLFCFTDAIGFLQMTQMIKGNLTPSHHKFSIQRKGYSV